MSTCPCDAVGRAVQTVQDRLGRRRASREEETPPSGADARQPGEEAEAGPAGVERGGGALASADAPPRLPLAAPAAERSQKLVRLFVSSTFDDMHAERNALQASVFPAFRRACQLRGWEFQVVDLRWGIRDEATDAHRTVPICMEEIARCRALSPRFNFLLLLGGRYGYRPLPDSLAPDLFSRLRAELLRAAEGGGGAAQLLERWYPLEANLLPPAHVLRTLTDETRQAFWTSVLPRLGPAVRAAASALRGRGEIEASAHSALVRSVTEQEVLAGMLGDSDAAGAAEHCACFSRELEGWDAAAEGARQFADEAHEEASALQAALRARVRAFLRPERFWEHTARWVGAGAGEAATPTHAGASDAGPAACRPSPPAAGASGASTGGSEAAAPPDAAPPGAPAAGPITTRHVPAMCAQVEAYLHERLEAEAAALPEADAHALELERHSRFALDRSREFVGRGAELRALLAHARGEEGDSGGRAAALLVLASSGAGKSSLLAAASEQLAASASTGEGPVVLRRFCGTTLQASSARALALSVAAELEGVAEGVAAAWAGGKGVAGAGAEEERGGAVEAGEGTPAAPEPSRSTTDNDHAHAPPQQHEPQPQPQQPQPPPPQQPPPQQPPPQPQQEEESSTLEGARARCARALDQALAALSRTPGADAPPAPPGTAASAAAAERSAEPGRPLGKQSNGPLLCFVIDALDQLVEFEGGAAEAGGRGAREEAMLGWLPSPLPPRVRLIASLLLPQPAAERGDAATDAAAADSTAVAEPAAAGVPQDASAMLARLNGVGGDAAAAARGTHGAGAAPVATPGGVLRLRALERAEIADVAQGVLRGRGRTVQPGQLAAIEAACARVPQPLFASLCAHAAAEWPAVLSPPPPLPDSLESAAEAMLLRLTRFHGRRLVGSALGALALAAGGLTEAELLDTLESDEALMTEVLQYHTPVPRKFPPIVWLRLRADLGRHLVEAVSAYPAEGGGGFAPAAGGASAGAGGARAGAGAAAGILRLYHRQLREAAARLFLRDDASARACAAAIARAARAGLDPGADRSWAGVARLSEHGAPRALRAYGRQLHTLTDALLRAAEWEALDELLTDLDVLEAALRSPALGHRYVSWLAGQVLSRARGAEARGGRAGVQRVSRTAALALLCRPEDASRFHPLPFVLPWESLGGALGPSVPPAALSAQIAARQRGTHALHVDGAMRWRCFDREFRDLTGARVLQPQRWRRPAAGGHRLVARVAGGAAGGAAAAAKVPGRAQGAAHAPHLGAEESPPLPAVVREMRRMGTMRMAAMLAGPSLSQLLPHHM